MSLQAYNSATDTLTPIAESDYKDSLEKISALPTASADLLNKCYLLTANQGAYVKGGIYQCQSDGSSGYTWILINGSGVPVDVVEDGNMNAVTSNAVSDKFDTLGTASVKDYTDTVRQGSHDLVESNAVANAINQALSSIYVPRGALSCAELTSALLIETNVGNVYEMSDSGTTSALFIQGVGTTISVGDNVGIIKAGEDTYMFNYMGNAFDLHSYQKIDLSQPIESATTVEGALGALNTKEKNDIKNVYEVMGKNGAKNLLKYPYYHSTKTENGVTFTDNGDGTITVDGTATAETTFYLFTAGNNSKSGTYTLSGCPLGGDRTNGYFLELSGRETSSSSWVTFGTDTGNGATITITEAQESWNRMDYFIRLRSGAVADNLTFKPMLRLAEDTDGTYAPYAKTNKQITEVIPSNASASNKLLSYKSTQLYADYQSNNTRVVRIEYPSNLATRLHLITEPGAALRDVFIQVTTRNPFVTVYDMGASSLFTIKTADVSNKRVIYINVGTSDGSVIVNQDDIPTSGYGDLLLPTITVTNTSDEEWTSATEIVPVKLRPTSSVTSDSTAPITSGGVYDAFGKTTSGTASNTSNVTSGTCTWVKKGSVVVVTINAFIPVTYTGGDRQLATGLPKPISYTAWGCNSVDGTVNQLFSIGTNGVLMGASGNMHGGIAYYQSMTYLTND